MKYFPGFGVRGSLIKLILYTFYLDADCIVYFGVTNIMNSCNLTCSEMR